MLLDSEKYRQRLEGRDLTPDQIQQVLEALWALAQALVDHAFSGGSMVSENAAKDAFAPPNVLSFEEKNQHHYSLGEARKQLSSRGAEEDRT